jgi:type I restriction enzyme S subunit
MLSNYEKGVVSTLYICFKLNDEQSCDFYQHYFEAVYRIDY